MNNKILNIIVADDHKLFRSGLIELLNSEPGYRVIAEAENGSELLKYLEDMDPDLLLIDISMPVIPGLEALKQIKKINPRVKTLFISMYDSEPYISAVIKAGGDGLISKNVAKEVVYNAINVICSGGKYFKDYNAGITNPKLSGIDPVLLFNNNDLTIREKKILFMISEGKTSAEIANELNIAKRTVDFHRTSLITKLGLKSLPALVRFAIQYSILHNKS